MTVDDHLILRLAKLARLAPDPKQTEQLRQDLAGILAMVEKLDELDLDGVEPLRYVTDVEQSLRPDRAGDHLDREKAMGNAPRSDGEFFLVPRVI